MPAAVSISYLLVALALPVLAAVLLQAYMFSGLTPPPSDYGKGSMFDSIAVRYDMINRVLAVGMDVGWRQVMVDTIAASPLIVNHNNNNKHPRILDVATGTADVALLLAKTIPAAHITGVDPSRHMLHVGRQKVAQRDLSDAIALRLHDAQDFSALRRHDDDATTSPLLFDAATMAFGIRNVPDRPKALCQIHSVLQTGATLCVLEFSEPDESRGMLGAIARLFIRHVVPIVGGLLSGKPREYWHLQHSIQDFPSPKEFGELLEGLECLDGGGYRLEDVIHLNFGSVQIYVSTVLRNKADTTE